MSSSETRASRRHRPEEWIVTGVRPEALSPAEVARDFRELLERGGRLVPAGLAREQPEVLLSRRYLPRYEVRLFDATFFLGGMRFNQALGFFVGYVALGGPRARKLFPRIFYKDSSLVWRVASHFIHDHEEYWIGKGDVRWERHGGDEFLTTAEETTNLPYELQAAFDDVSRRQRRVRDDDAIGLVLREAPSGRLQAYADFVTPRRRAAEQHRIHGGRPIARFRDRSDPSSLEFARGFEPDFASGVIETADSVSKFFGGKLQKFRILSANRRVQYQFCATPTCAWINAPQALTTELSTYGVRVHDVRADDRLYVPAFEYHDEEDTHDSLAQIPAGYAGPSHPKDPHRSDASAWIEALPVMREFRTRVLGRRRARR